MLISAANHQDVLTESSEKTDEMQKSNILTQEKEIILEQRRNIENILLRSWSNNPHTPGTGRMCSLSAVTRWSPDSIRKWFRQKTVERRDQERQDALKEEQRITQLLLASFEMNPRTPTMRSNRMRELQAITGRTSTYIQDWFSRQRVRDQYGTLCREKAILIAAFEEDPTLPVCQSERMSKLMEKTGRSVWYIQDWFSRLLKQYETKRRKITLKNPLSMEETEQVNEEIKKRYEEMVLQKRTRRKKRDAPVRYQDAETNGHVTVCNDPPDDIRRVQQGSLSSDKDAYQAATPENDQLTKDNRHVIAISSDGENIPVVMFEDIAQEEQIGASNENGEESTESRYQPTHEGQVQFDPVDDSMAILKSKERHTTWSNDVSVREKATVNRTVPDILMEIPACDLAVEPNKSNDYVIGKKPSIATKRKIAVDQHDGDCGVANWEGEDEEILTTATRQSSPGLDHRNALSGRKLEQNDQRRSNHPILIASFKGNPETPRGDRLQELCGLTSMKAKEIQNWFEEQSDEYCKVLTSDDNGSDKNEENEDNTADILDMVGEKQQQTFESMPSSAVEKAKKCSICDNVCAVQSLSIVRYNHSPLKKLDKHFGFSLTHFLTYTRVVCVCIEHALEYRESTK